MQSQWVSHDSAVMKQEVEGMWSKKKNKTETEERMYIEVSCTIED